MPARACWPAAALATCLTRAAHIRLTVRTERGEEAGLSQGCARFEAGGAQYENALDGVDISLNACLSPEDGTLFHAVRLHNSAPTARETELTLSFPVALCHRDDCWAHPAFQSLFRRLRAHWTGGALVFTRRPGGSGALPLGARGAGHGRGSDVGDGPRPLRGPRGPMPRARFPARWAARSTPARRCACGRGWRRGRRAMCTSPSPSSPRRTRSAGRSATPRRPRRSAPAASPPRRRGRCWASPAWAPPPTTCSTALRPFCSTRASPPAPARTASGGEQRAAATCGPWASAAICPSSARPSPAAPGLPLAREAVRAHDFYRTMGVESDLVLINDYGNDYEQPVRDALRDMIAASHLRDRSRRARRRPRARGRAALARAAGNARPRRGAVLRGRGGLPRAAARPTGGAGVRRPRRLPAPWRRAL